MRKNLKAFGNMIDIRQILIGLAVLLLGTLVYLIDRSPDQTYFVEKSFVNISLHNILPNLFGFVGSSLPSFIHVFSFILITAGLLHWQKRGCIFICSCWFIVDCTFELGQKFKLWSSKIIPDWFNGILFLENTKTYFIRGTFDYFDLAAITLGAIAAYFVLLHTIQMEKVS
jgi:ABC-type xylose transport system permease subunit